MYGLYLKLIIGGLVGKTSIERGNETQCWAVSHAGEEKADLGAVAQQLLGPDY